MLAEGPLVAVLLWSSWPGPARIHGYSQLALALIPVVVLPLLWRRRAPFGVFWIIFAAAFAQVFTSQEFTNYLAMLVAFYTVAVQEPHRRVLAAAAALECGAVLIAIRESPPGAKQAWLWVFLSILAAAAGLLGYYVRGRKAYLAALVDRAERLERERQQEAELAASAERARVAREMHDIVAHNIAVMIALADGAAYTIGEDPDRATALMSHVSATGRSALAEMRRLLGVLRQPGTGTSGNAPPPGLADLDALLETVRAAGLPVRLTVSGQPYPLPPTAQLALYRMIQEALTNTLKHADATSAHVSLGYRGGEVELEVTDDGRLGGIAAHIPPGAGSTAAGQGLAGMRERAAVFGGEVRAGPRPEGGWRVHTLLRAGASPAAGTEGT